MSKLTPNEILNLCVAAGDKAAIAAVAPYEGPADYHNEGLCGFAHITIKPARGAFVKFLKENNIGSRGVYGGYTVSAYNFMPTNAGTQSYDRKKAACDAVVQVLAQHGVKAFTSARLD